MPHDAVGGVMGLEGGVKIVEGLDKISGQHLGELIW